MKTHASVDDKPSQRLTMSLIAECTGTSSNLQCSADARAEELLRAEVLRLDWQRISSIENLDSFTHVRELYLQHNRIDIIEELGTLHNLEFLALGSNRIRRLENLRHLKKLQVLDLSHNAIEDVDTKELPVTLIMLNLLGNPCCLHGGLRKILTSALMDLMVLNEQPVDRSPTAVGAEECKGTSDVKHVRVEDGVQGTDECITLYVTVISDGVSKVVPFHFSSADSMAQRASRFCADNSLHGSEEALLTQMEDATTRSKACVSVVERHTEERPETEEGTDLEKDEKLHAIINLQRARARVMQESTASFEQHKRHILAATRKLVDRKTAAAHGRSDALEEDISKTLDDARSELRLRRERASAENRQFAADMRQKIDRVLAERRRESEAAGRVTPTTIGDERSTLRY